MVGVYREDELVDEPWELPPLSIREALSDVWAALVQLWTVVVRER